MASNGCPTATKEASYHVPLTFLHPLLESDVCCENLGLFLQKGSWWQQSQDFVFFTAFLRFVSRFSFIILILMLIIRPLSSKISFKATTTLNPPKKPPVFDNRGQSSCYLMSSSTTCEGRGNTAPLSNHSSSCPNDQLQAHSCSAQKCDESPPQLCNSCSFCKETCSIKWADCILWCIK